MSKILKFTARPDCDDKPAGNLIVIDQGLVAPPVPLYITGNTARDYEKAIEALVTYGCPRKKAYVIAQTCSLVAEDSQKSVIEIINQAINRLAEGATPSEVYNWITDQAINPD